MKKGFLILFVLGLSCLAFSHPVFWDKDLSLNLEPEISFTLVKDPRSQNTTFSVRGDFSNDIFSADTGFNYVKDTFDVTTGIMYAPRVFDRMNFGIRTRYHFYNYADLFCEHDFITGFYYNLARKNVFSMNASISYFLKASLIPSILEFYGPVIDNSLAVNLHFDWLWAKRYEAFLDVGTTSYFDYLLFVTPIFRTGFLYHINDRFSAGTDLYFKLIDMFTVSENLTQMKLGFFCQMRVL